MTIQHANASMSFDSEAVTSSNPGNNVYKLVRRSVSSIMNSTVLVVSKKASGSQVSLEVADELELGYKALAKDVDEIAIAAQRRVNRGSVPGRLIAD